MPKALPIVFFLFLMAGVNLFGQGVYKHIKELKNSDHSEIISWCYFPSVLDSSAHGQLSLIKNGSSYEVFYDPELNFIGNDTVVIEYSDGPGQGAKKLWKSYIYCYVNSYLEVRSDFYTVYKNQTNVDIQPMGNDSTSIPGANRILISGISSTKFLSSYSQLNDSVIRFTPIADYIGPATIVHKVCDTFGLCESNTIYISVIDTNQLPNTDTLLLGTPEDQSVQKSLPKEGFSLNQNPKNGSVKIDGASFIYKPFNNFNGKDTFNLVNGTLSRKVFMRVYPMAEPNSILVPDLVYTPVNKEITFNVAANDVQSIVSKFSVLKDKDPARGTLTKLDNIGNFKYVPETDYKGVQTFTYKVCPQNCETAEVRIFIGDYEPQTLNTYQIATPRNTPILLNYQVPVNAYNFSSSSDSVKFYPGWDTINVSYNNGCQSQVIGYNSLIYYPKLNDVSPDNFTIEYCINGTNRCVTADFDVDVYYEAKNCPKQCVGDCVWPGDVDQSGCVDMKDLLHIGYELGQSGPVRSYQGSTFRSYSGSNWGKELVGRSIDIKNADTNGDGKVTASDTLAISNSYHKTHSLISKEVFSKGDFPFLLENLSGQVDSGDWMMIEVQLGEDAAPAINLAGYSYVLNYNKDVVYEPSLYVNFYDDGWFASSCNTLNMFKKPFEGRLESGFVRANGKKVSGHGGTEVLVFIVEDDIDPFRDDDGIIEVPFYFQDILIQDGEGNLKQLEDKTFVLKLDRRKNKEVVLDPSKLLVFPNPASDHLIMHLNGKNGMVSYSVISMDGKEMFKKSAIDPKHELIDLSGLANGLYLIKTETLLGPITKKILVQN
jgi:hypothetical protein